MEGELYTGVNFVKHSDKSTWRFDLDPYKNIYRNSEEDIENEVFVRHHKSCDKLDNNSEYLSESDLEDFRKAAVIHKVVRSNARKYLFNGGRLSELVDSTEALILKLTKQDPQTYYLKGSDKSYDAGIAFPVGVNINNVVAHDSKVTALVDERTFTLGDVVKVDIGVHINGRIIDSAFTHIISSEKGVTDSDNIYTPVLEASRDSVFSTIKLSGPDQLLYELSENIQEIIESYEVELPKSTMAIKAVQGIGGHNILKHQIHGGKLILCVPDEEIQGEFRMKEDEVYAIETYASTGMGQMTQNDTMAHCTHFMEMDKKMVESNRGITKNNKKMFRKLPFYDWLQTRHGLPFSSSWLQTRNTKVIDKMEKAFKLGITSGQLIAYPPLNEEQNSVVAQFEHTIHLGRGFNSDTVEIFSLGSDY